MELQQIRLFRRHDAPCVVPPDLIAECTSYREAVQLCWNLRRDPNMHQQELARLAGLYASHVSCYLDKDTRSPRDLPGRKVREFEAICDNTAISQFFNRGAKLTVTEEVQAMMFAMRVAA